jgi:uncharacterized small protein (DUF1192 family)
MPVFFDHGLILYVSDFRVEAYTYQGKIHKGCDRMFADDLPKPKTSEFPRNLEFLSVDELQAYTAALEGEIDRVRQDIGKKRAAIDAAAAFFGSDSE